MTIVELIEWRIKRYDELVGQGKTLDEIEMEIYGHLPDKQPLTYTDFMKEQKTNP